MSEQGPTVFNGRYELLRHIARGGMADVYLARDELLDRQVALKVLFPEFANDPNFVERFRREAQAAANLNHPNIVGIYDWGQERGTYYIVMEFVEGRSIADVLRSTGPLHPDRVAEIAVDVAAALGIAHAAGLVHRDIKLGNILISDGGDVKVADFGIATALAANTEANLTQAGSVMGTATYFSPEQAQGKHLDGRSDLYSLGVVMYEMLTGVAPFVADTPVAVAYKHVQERPVPPSQAGATVAQSLEAITLKLLAKNPANRYPAADDLRSDLRRYLAGAHSIPRNATASAPVPDAAAPPASAPARVPVPVSQPITPANGAAVDPTTAIPTQYPPGYYYDEQPHRDDGWKRTALLMVGLAVLVGVLAFLVVAFIRTLSVGNDDAPEDDVVLEQIEVPSVIELSLEVAENTLRDLGLVTDVDYQVNTSLAPNVVFGQTPPSGQRVDEGSTVILTVSQGEIPSVPPVRGRTQDDATIRLEDAGYVVIAIEESNQAEAGIVIGQDPAAGTELAEDNAVTITVSSGPGQVLVPNVKNQTLVNATVTLTTAGFRVQTIDEPSETVESGSVVDTDPVAGTPLEPGAQITVIVSSGIPLVVVPDVVGLRADSARLALERENLVVTITFEQVPEGSPDVGQVRFQNPPALLEVEQGTVVELVVGEAAPATTTTTSSTTTTTSSTTTSMP